MRTGARIRAVLVLALAGLCLSPTTGCDSNSTGGRPETTLTEPENAVDEALMVALLQAKNYHHKADIYLGEGQTESAIAELRNVLEVRFPAGAAEGEDVKLDATARLAKLLLTEDRATEAMAIVDEALRWTQRESFFLANLYSVRGQLRRALAKDAASAGTADGDATARQLRREAIADYDHSNQINQALQNRLLGERGSGAEVTP